MCQYLNVSLLLIDVIDFFYQGLHSFVALNKFYILARVIVVFLGWLCIAFAIADNLCNQRPK